MPTAAIRRFQDALERRNVEGWDLFAVIAPLILILVAEAVFYSASKSMETELFAEVVVLHAANIMLCLLVPIVFKTSDRIFQGFLLISVLRLLTIGMPNFSGVTLEWTILVYLPLLPVILFMLMDERFGFSMEPGEFPFQEIRGHARQALGSVSELTRPAATGLMLGVPLGLVGQMALGLPALATEGLGGALLALLAILLFAAVAEELLFRRVLQSRITERLGSAPGIAASALAYGMLHSGYADAAALLFFIAAGAAIGYAYRRSGSLSLAVCMNGAMGLMMFAVLPLAF